jgi:hypothetical protein
VGDFNGDGVQDLAAANENSNNVSVLIGTGTGSFGAASNFPAGANPEWVAVGDFNGDGVQDLATANRTSNNVSVLIGTGTGSFGAASNFPVGANPIRSPWAISTATAYRIWPPLIRVQTTYRSSCAPAPRHQRQHLLRPQPRQLRRQQLQRRLLHPRLQRAPRPGLNLRRGRARRRIPTLEVQKWSVTMKTNNKLSAYILRCSTAALLFWCVIFGLFSDQST